MSASLVGSEMCIRDSLNAGLDVGQVGGALQLVNDLRGGRITRPLPSPVSYTHLTLPTICSV
eukprot:11413102-Alexandrium_andersonii.AAC.1